MYKKLEKRCKLWFGLRQTLESYSLAQTRCQKFFFSFIGLSVFVLKGATPIF